MPIASRLRWNPSLTNCHRTISVLSLSYQKRKENAETHCHKKETWENTSDHPRTDGVQYHTVECRISPVPHNNAWDHKSDEGAHVVHECGVANVLGYALLEPGPPTTQLETHTCCNNNICGCLKAAQWHHAPCISQGESVGVRNKSR
jgi:hypothetical protein